MRKFIRQFLELESSSSILLFVMAFVSLVVVNSPFEYLHARFIDVFIFWINEGAMALFFLLIGIELKRGYLEGELSSFSQVALPGIGALGGMLVPAFIYVTINIHDPVTLQGWATPVATDTAFALGVLTLFGKRIPQGLKLFLLALAIFDDVAAIMIITFFYSAGLQYMALLQAFILMGILYAFNRLNVMMLLPYLLIGVWLWLCLLHAGIHPTLTGFLLAMMVPAAKDKAQSPLHRLEHGLHPFVAFLIMPLFAFANTGLPLMQLSWGDVFSTVVIGVALGLFVGKQLGVFLFSWLFIRFRLARLPTDTSWLAFYGVALLCGIGFTMSLFLGTLSFKYGNEIYIDDVRLGVIIGSLLSGLMGAFILSIAQEKQRT